MNRQLLSRQPLKSIHWLLLAMLGLACDDWKLPRKSFPVATGLVAYYPFNGNTLDESGNNLHGFLKNGATYGADRKPVDKAALLLDGIDDYFEIPDNVRLRPAILSISLWMKPQKVTSTTEIYYKSVFKDNQYYQFAARITPPYTTSAASGYEIVADIEQDANCALEDKVKKKILYFDPGYQLDKWIHIVTVFEGKTGKLYLNGERKLSESELRDAPLDNCAGGTLRFGTAWENDLNAFSGSMDEIRIYNRALTDSEIKALYQQ